MFSWLKRFAEKLQLCTLLCCGVFMLPSDCAPSFTREPNSGNPMYTEGSGPVTFSWDYNPDGLTVDRVVWQYRRDISATPQLIASKQISRPPLVSPSYRERITFSGSATLTISNIQESDSGIYKCWVSFASFNPPWITSESELIVVVRPTITPRTTQPVTITEGGSATLFCFASGNPKPTYIWYRYSTEVQNDQAANSNYTIISATKHDAGNYRCRASVSGGGLGPYNADYIVDVIVQYKPTVTNFTTGTPNNAVVRGNKVTVTCKADGYPAPTYVIERDGVVVNEVADGIVEINNVQLSEESANYSCVSTNSMGNGPRKDLRITVEEKPSTGISSASVCGPVISVMFLNIVAFATYISRVY